MTKGVVAASDPQTAGTGARILEAGGNAVDAAVAAAFTSFVVEFSLVNVGGSGMATIFDSRLGSTDCYDFFSTMPSGQVTKSSDFREILVDYGPTTQPFYIGRASVAIPGAVAGLCQMAVEHGTLPLERLLQPAITFARDGFTLSPALTYAYELLQPIFTDTPGIAAIYVPNGEPYQAGETITLPQLAETLEKLGRTGPDYFYSGALAQQIVADQTQHGGLISAADLAAYRVHKVPPIRIAYRDCTILLPPPSSVGGVLIGFALSLLGSIDLSKMSHNGPEHLHALAEVMRLTNIARGDWEKIQQQEDVKPAERVANFLSEERLNRFQTKLQRAMRVGSSQPEPILPSGPSDTTHISVADEHGTVVSITTSAGEYAGYVVGETGVCLNNMLGEIDLHPGGFHQLSSGERLTTMMTPTVVLRNGQPILAIGSGGANRIRSAILQSISNVIDFQLPVLEAVNKPRIHFEEGILQLEGGIDDQTANALADWGYQINRWDGLHMFFGGAHAVEIAGDKLQAAGDQRRGGSVAAVTR